MKQRDPRYTEPFHRREPLRFECTGCGDCCCGEESHVYLEPGEAEALCAHLGLTWEWFRRRYLARDEDGERVLASNGNCCVFLDADRHCRVYAARPLQCRTYPFWPELVATRRAWERERQRCEGIGRGAAVPLAHIEAQLSRQRKA